MVRVDVSGNHWKTIVKIVLTILSYISNISRKIKYGAAQNYVFVKGEYDSPNCYGYALGLDSAFNPGSKSGVIPKFNNVNEVAMAVISDLKAMGRQGRIIESWDSDIQPNEYRIALRCGLTPYRYGLNGCSIKKLYDYHFMVQHSDGRWSEKHGTASNSIVYDKNMNPSNISWDLEDKIGYYDSSIIYIAITR